MPENQDAPETTLDVSVPEQETPKEETPSATAPEEQTPPAEKPAQTDSPVEDAGKPEKTPEQIADDKAFFQAESQQAKEELAALRGQAAERAEEKPTEGKPVAEKPTSQFDQMSDEEVNEYLKEHPLDAMRIQETRQAQILKSTLGEMLDDRDRKSQYNHEAGTTRKVLNAFCQKHGISAEQFEEARSYFETLGIQANPSAVGELIIDRLQGAMVRGNIGKAQTNAAAQAAQAVKQQLLTQQPTTQGQPDASTPKTQEEVVAAKFGESKAKAALDSMFN